MCRLLWYPFLSTKSGSACAGQNANAGMLPPSDSEDESEEEKPAPTKAKQVLLRRYLLKVVPYLPSTVQRLLMHCKSKGALFTCLTNCLVTCGVTRAFPKLFTFALRCSTNALAVTAHEKSQLL